MQAMQYGSPKAIWNLLFGVSSPPFEQNEGNSHFCLVCSRSIFRYSFILLCLLLLSFSDKFYNRSSVSKLKVSISFFIGTDEYQNARVKQFVNYIADLESKWEFMSLSTSSCIYTFYICVTFSIFVHNICLCEKGSCSCRARISIEAWLA